MVFFEKARASAPSSHESAWIYRRRLAGLAIGSLIAHQTTNRLQLREYLHDVVPDFYNIFNHSNNVCNSILLSSGLLLATVFCKPEWIARQREALGVTIAITGASLSIVGETTAMESVVEQIPQLVVSSVSDPADILYGAVGSIMAGAYLRGYDNYENKE